ATAPPYGASAARADTSCRTSAHVRQSALRNTSRVVSAVGSRSGVASVGAEPIEAVGPVGAVRSAVAVGAAEVDPGEEAGSAEAAGRGPATSAGEPGGNPRGAGRRSRPDSRCTWWT